MHLMMFQVGEFVTGKGYKQFAFTNIKTTDTLLVIPTSYPEMGS